MLVAALSCLRLVGSTVRFKINFEVLNKPYSRRPLFTRQRTSAVNPKPRLTRARTGCVALRELKRPGAIGASMSASAAYLQTSMVDRQV